ncbi:hypothetical protein KC331_g3842 [Hortaea werneckii]|uniref:Uncharacterized protein n=1 Tax=Hortaea werneckii TaxID=91943 RepID=A0A3M7C313_HORWE|nr:hypothetical protein KC349_g6746 [Hortaea werneckii]KAI7549366.1 hypothetical protein KC331_g3842 [Hortaea werneckii]KAI7717730.1 hypothetical protein KC353_g4358 [Hortaea werneckii]RMY46458.1 hypothetical protein D0865_09274 [Hortaea werneckii]
MALGAEEVVAIAICGALAAIGMGWALTHRFYMNKGREEAAAQNPGSGYSQAQYMREVRLRHQEDLAASQYGYGRAHFPMATPSAMESHGTLHYAESPKEYA